MLRIRVAALVLASVSAAGSLAACGAPLRGAPHVPAALSSVTVQIHLVQTRIPAGMPLRGYATITNHTHRTLPLYGCPGQQLTIGLESASIPFDPAVALDGCRGTDMLPPGTRRLALSGYTTYSGCGGGAAMHELPCPRFGDPLLPLGGYHLKVITTGFPSDTVVAPTPAVTLVNASTGQATGSEGASILIVATACGWTGSPATSRLPVSVVLSHDHQSVARAAGRGYGEFIFPAVVGRYTVRTSAGRGGVLFTSNAVESYINLFSRCT